jgi:predicted DNA-binding transcriptional regulator YafY
VNHKGKESRFVISPYTLVAYKRGLYVLGAVEEWGGKLLTYGLERITEAEWRQGDGFDYPDDFDPEAFFEKALFIAPGDPRPVELVFTKTIRPFIMPRRFHETQSLSALPDGTLRMTLTVPIDFETVNWILSFGANVAVVSPPELRDKVKAELARALYQYR